MFNPLTNKLKPPGGLTEPAADLPRFEVPMELSKLQARTGADLAQVGGFAVPADAADPATQSPAAFLSTALNERQEVRPVTKALAHQLPATDGVRWAVDSCLAVKDKL